MKLAQFTVGYWMAVCAIALTSGLIAIVCGLTSWSLFHQLRSANLNQQVLSQKWICLLPALSSGISFLIIPLTLRRLQQVQKNLDCYIDDCQQTEAALQQSEARFRVVAETAACAFFVYQGNHLRYANPATEEITEYSQEELMNVNFWDLAHPDFRELIRARGLARQRGEAVPPRYDIKILTKSGKVRWVNASAGATNLNGQPAAVATAYDITDRKEAEAQLQLAANQERLMTEIALRIRSSLNLEEILNTTVAEVRQFLKADRVFIAHLEPGADCRIVAESVNPEWFSILGWRVDQTAIAEIQHMFELDSVRVVNDTAHVKLTPFLKEYYHYCQVKAGMGIAILLNGEMFGVLIVNQCSGPRDWQPFEVSLLKKLCTQIEIAIQQGQLHQQLRALALNLECQVEERTLELQQRMQELESLNQVKDVLLHAVTHDLRTPVQGTLMVLNHLRGRCDEGVMVSRTVIDRMVESSDRQLSLLNSLMEIHAQTQTIPALARESLSLSSLVSPVVEKLRALFERNQTTVTMHIAPDLPPISADVTKVQQVFEELLSNAVRHNAPGRQITISASVTNVLPMMSPEKMQREVATTCVSAAAKSFLYCAVEDDGGGLTQKQRDRLFKLYVRGLDNQHLTGIGLGLYHCQQILAAHDGKIGVDSIPGRGSRFWCVFPLNDKETVGSDRSRSGFCA
jgi:PAS domain S-box-containing protein